MDMEHVHWSLVPVSMETCVPAVTFSSRSNVVMRSRLSISLYMHSTYVAGAESTESDTEFVDWLDLVSVTG